MLLVKEISGWFFSVAVDSFIFPFLLYLIRIKFSYKEELVFYVKADKILVVYQFEISGICSKSYY